MDASGPRYRDREESRFYQAGGLSPEQLEGAAPEAIRRELQAVCSSFNLYADALGDPDTTAVLDRTRFQTHFGKPV
jgi:hypothetical protein